MGSMRRLNGNYAAAAATSEQGVALQRELGGALALAEVLGDAALVARERDYARAGTLLAESEARAQTLDGKAMVGMSDVARDQGDWGCASSAGEASLALFRAAGNALGTAFALHNLGLAAHGRGDFAGAQMLLE